MSKPMVQVREEYQGSKEECRQYLSSILDKISSRFTKMYLPVKENVLQDSYYFIPVEFFERKSKLPIPEHKAVMIFKVGRNLRSDNIFIHIDNESVSFPLLNSLNLSFFETLLDRILHDKYHMSKALYLQTNFELTRVLNLNGETKRLYTLEDDDNIFSNNRSDYYKYEGVDLAFKKLEVEHIDKIIKQIWKTLVPNSNEAICNPEVQLSLTYENFKLLFEYGKLDMNEENIGKLWKYSNKRKGTTLNYEEFANFAVYLIFCLHGYTIALYKHNNNNCFENKIKNCVEIMNLHFKEYDSEGNEEITYENLKKCLLKENELFTRKEIDTILQQINPEANFQYWKFDKILDILFYNYFNYQKLIAEDKIYKYLITISTKQDPFNSRKLHYKKMKQAFLTEDKINFDKTEILLILNHFGINANPEIEYYPASLILRNIVEYLLSSEVGMQKIDITQPLYMKYEGYEDEYDKISKNIKELFISYDRDYDHLLNKKEFLAFIKWLIPYIDDEGFEEIFIRMDTNKDNVISYQEFQNGFEELMTRTRVKNVIKEITTIKETVENKEVKEDKEGNANE